MLFEHMQKIEFEVFRKGGNGMSYEIANPLLEKFREKLLSLKYQDFYPDENISGRIISVDDFSWTQPVPHLLNCRYEICKWSVRDDSGNAVENFNNQTRQRLAKIISQIRIGVEESGAVLRVNNITQF